MSLGLGPARPSPVARILVVDDDRRVAELLAIALGQRGYEVLSAHDGEDALRQTLAARPDLIVLDVRLPRRSGFDVCEMLRRDPEWSWLPIVMVSAAGETEARLQAFAKGADDYLTKPFSPKELIARIERLLVRAGEARDSVKRLRELERELHRVQDEVRRAKHEAHREQHLRRLAFDAGGEIHGALDLDTVAARLLEAVRARLGWRTVALLLPDAAGARLVPHAVLGGDLGRVGGLEFEREGDLATLVRGLGRPLPRRLLERFAEVAPELPPLIAAGVLVLAPLTVAGALEGLLVGDGRPDRAELDRAEDETLSGLCDLAAIAIANARRVRATIEATLEWLADADPDALPRARRAEAQAVVARAAGTLALSPRHGRLVHHAVGLGRFGHGAPGLLALEALGGGDPTGFAADLRRLLDRAERIGDREPAGDPAFERAALLAAIAMRFAEERSQGLAPDAALALATEGSEGRLEPAAARALRDALAPLADHAARDDRAA